MSDNTVTHEECKAILTMESNSIAIKRLARAHIALLDSHQQTIQQERERCARIAEAHVMCEVPGCYDCATKIASAIRSGG